MPNKVTEEEVDSFLERKLNLQLATNDEDGYPSIQPLWFLYDKEYGKIYISTQKTTGKAHNLSKNFDKIYFSIDDENLSYNGVKGRKGRKIRKYSWSRTIMEKIIVKYLGTMDNPLAQMFWKMLKKVQL